MLILIGSIVNCFAALFIFRGNLLHLHAVKFLGYARELDMKDFLANPNNMDFTWRLDIADKIIGEHHYFKFWQMPSDIYNPSKLFNKPALIIQEDHAVASNIH